MTSWIRKWMHHEVLYEDLIPGALNALPKLLPRLFGFAIGHAHI